MPLKLSLRILLGLIIHSCLILTGCMQSTSTSLPANTITPHIIYTAMVAKTEGFLKNVDGCIRVSSREFGDGDALVWPPDYKMTIEDGQIRVVSGIVTGDHQEIVIKYGEWVLLGGGNVSELDEQLQSTIPDNCPGPYWVVGQTIRPIRVTPEP